MMILEGKAVCGGIAIGTIRFYRRQETAVTRERIQDERGELARFEQAREQTIKQLEELYDKALREVGEANAAIFEMHRMMVEDEDFLEAIKNVIETQKVNAEYAVAVTEDNFAEMFAAMEDEYMRARAADVRDVSDRIIRNLTGTEELSSLDGKYVICADDLAPSETVLLDKSRVLAFVTRYGSSNSHTAILARTMGIPAIIGAEGLREELEGREVIVDGYGGKLYVDPEEELLQKMRTKQEEDRKHRQLLSQLKGKDNVTLDGRRIDVFANIGGLHDVGAVILNDAGGIGLFRSEFLYLESEDYPDEHKQFIAYKKILESMADKKVVIRTLDIGADKQIDYFGLDREENPALGLRAIRICLTRPELFKTQLRALFRASVYGNLAILFPMITSLEEVTRIKEMVELVKEELRTEEIAFRDSVELGIMVETPAAAIISDRLAPEVDFFSIGTNDLTQYTLACDRQNAHVEQFCDPHHEAILRLIQMTVEAAHSHGKWVGICGELGGDVTLTETWLRMGVDELSVSPSLVLPVREKVRSLGGDSWSTGEKGERIPSLQSRREQV